MSDDVKPDDVPVNVVELVDHSQAMFRLRLAGESVREIARQYRISEKRVQETIERMCTPITKQMKAHTLELELERLDELQAAFYRAAREGNLGAAAITLKIVERRAAMLGLDAPSAVRTDPVLLIESSKPQETSTDKIMAALNRIAGKYPKNVDGTDGEPPSSPPAA